MNVADSRTSQTREAHPRWLRSPLVVAALLLLAALVARLIGFVPSMINPDESVFALAAREVVNGQLPYLTFFDNKPVGSTLIIAAFFKIFGQSIVTVRLLGALSVWAAAMLVAALVERGGFTRLQGLFAGLLVIAFTLPMGGLAIMTEILLLPYTALGVLLLYAALRPARSGRRLLMVAAAGLAIGGAILIKIVPVVPGFAVAGLVLLLLLRRRDVSLGGAVALALAFTIGAALPMVATVAVYAGVGRLPELLHANFGFASAYGDIRPGLKMTAQRLSTTVDSLWPLLALAAIGVAALVRDWRRGNAPDLAVLATVWLLGELVAAAASRHFYPHYFLDTVPPLAVLALFGARALAGWIGVTGVGSRAVALVCVIAALIPFERVQVDMLRDINAEGDPQKQVAGAIGRASGGERPTLFVTNYKLMGLYSLTGAPLPPTRFAVAPHLFSRQSRMTGADPQVETARVLASRPRFIVLDSSEKLPFWAQAQFAGVERDYRLLRRVGTIGVYQLDR